MARMDCSKIMEVLEITGSGPRYQSLIENAPSVFSIKSEDDSVKLKVYIGENPDTDVNIWVRGNFSNNLQDVINELKQNLKNNRNLEMVAVENLNLSSLTSNYYVLMCRDEVLRSFQNSEDLNNYLLDRFKLNMAI